MSMYKIFSQSKNKIFMVFGFILLCASMGVHSAPYVPPIGIPPPEFGINETVESVYDSDAYFTHYVDNTDDNATDTDNPNGSEDKPRMTIPRTLAAGSVVEVRGGPYVNSDTYVTLQMNGTASAPIFIRGVSNGGRVVFLGESDNSNRTDFTFQGQYYIVENIDFYNKARIVFDPNSKYGTLRNSEIHNPIGSVGALNPTISASGEHTVIYDNEIHDNARTLPDAENSKDTHGIQGSAGGDRIWVLNNKIYNNGGDGFQACHRCNTSPLGQPKNIYIGGNDFNGDKENGVDLKYATDVIISQNTFSNYKIDFDSGPACPIVVGSDGAPTRVWIIFNEIFDSKRSIRVEEASDLWIVGNTIHDIETNAIALEKRGDLVRVINNTVYNADLFIDQYWRHEFAVNVHNNIVVDMVGAQYGNHMYFESSQVYPASDFQNNLFWQSGNDVLLRLGTGTAGRNEAFSSSADFDDFPFGNNNIIGDPLFVNEANNNFRLQAGSAARDAGLSSVVYQEFYNLYGIKIQQDKSGLARPQQEVWDIGAYEYTDSELEVITHSLVNGQVGSVVSYSIIATGGIAPYTWSLSVGALPDGLSLNTATGVISGTPMVAGDYDFTLMVQDDVQASDSQLLSLTVDTETVSDEIAPVITLNGNNPQTITLGDAYNELGASAIDNKDGDISGMITINVSAVKTDVVGTYEVTYNVKDAAGNIALEQIRKVQVTAVVDTTPPVIILKGDNPQIITLGNSYNEHGARAEDNVDGDISDQITIDVSALNTNVVGSYEVMYNVKDAAGNAAQEAIRTVNVKAVVDTTPPVITLNGNASITITVDGVYVEAGATALDNLDGDISGKIVIDASALDSTMVGSYSVTYNVTDEAGNVALQVIRTVKVSAANNAKPVVTVTASSYGPLGLLMMSVLLFVLRRRSFASIE